LLWALADGFASFMNETNSLAIFSKAALMLAEADTIQKTKELKDMAIVAGEWARRKGAGEAAIQHCRSYALEAERKMGELLAQTERAKPRPGPGRGKVGDSALPTLPDSAPTLASLGLTKRESSEAQKIAALPEKRFEALKAGTQTKKEALNPTHVGQNSGENEWYTPAQFLDAARKAMGSIACDPASSAVANKTVKAETFFTKEQDGLKHKWTGKVWLNPPYAQPLVAEFSAAVCEKLESKEIKQAIVLVNNATETAWFQQMLSVAEAVCFVKGRVKFLDPQGNPGAPLQGQAVLCLGGDAFRFRKAFADFGPVLFREHV
jgi:ParB family chromosome partitioning protein